jgi:hypothetical protein
LICCPPEKLVSILEAGNESVRWVRCIPTTGVLRGSHVWKL